MKLVRVAGSALLLLCSSAATAQVRHSPIAARLLHAHNIERYAVGAAPLMWDSRLAAAAASYAAQMARTGRWGHSSPDRRAGQGENLWMGSRGAFGVDSMMSAWAAEKRLFRAGVFPNVSRTGSWQDVGHYTQIVWPATTRVGCSVASSDQWDYLVCRYSAPGNAMGARVGATRVAAR